MKKYICLLFLCFSMNVFAGVYSQMFFFGDSLTDNGNLYRAVKVIPKSPPYYEGRFSNGPVWSEYLGNDFNSKFNTFYQVYAVGGATAIYHSPVTGAFPYILKDEIDKFLKEFPVRSDTLYVIWIGGNDYLDEKKQDVITLTNEVVQGIIENIQTLMDNGAKHFLVMDLPNLASTPYAATQSDIRKERLNSLSQLHHVKLTDAIQHLQLENPNISFMYFDVYDLFNDVLINTDFYNQQYNLHLANKKDNCWTGRYVYKNAFYQISLQNAEGIGGAICVDPDSFIFWDKIHPTTAVHQLLAQIVEEKLLS